MDTPNPIKTLYTPLPSNKSGQWFGNDTLCRKLEELHPDKEIVGYGRNKENGSFILYRTRVLTINCY